MTLETPRTACVNLAPVPVNMAISAINRPIFQSMGFPCNQCWMVDLHAASRTTKPTPPAPANTSSRAHGLTRGANKKKGPIFPSAKPCIVPACMICYHALAFSMLTILRLGYRILRCICQVLLRNRYPHSAFSPLFSLQ